eukprot:1721383-Pleurochrysis_carterae.AAC.1
MELTRSNLVASGAPVTFWPYATMQAVDVLNRTTGPPRCPISSYESLTGVKARRGAYSKTRTETRAWVGINLGRSLTSPGAYHVWLPSVPRVVVTSEVDFDEGSYPWKNTKTDTTPAASVASPPQDSGADQPAGLPTAKPVDQMARSTDAMPCATPN